MTDAPRSPSKTPHVLSGLALAVAVAGTGGPAIARAIAPNSDKVDGFHAIDSKAKPAKRAGKLVATNGKGKLPSNIVAHPTLTLPDVLPAGTTMTGLWGIDAYDESAAQDGSWGSTISFPVPVPEGMKLKVLEEFELSEECPGPTFEPTALPGWVCVYTTLSDNSRGPSSQMSTKYGVSLWVNDDMSQGDIFYTGTWAATAPR